MSDVFFSVFFIIIIISVESTLSLVRWLVYNILSFFMQHTHSIHFLSVSSHTTIAHKYRLNYKIDWRIKFHIFRWRAEQRKKHFLFFLSFLCFRIIIIPAETKRIKILLTFLLLMRENEQYFLSVYKCFV